MNVTHEANDETSVTTEFDAAGTPPDIERNTPSPIALPILLLQN